MDTYLNNLRIIEIKIREAMEKWNKEDVNMWKKASDFELSRIKEYIYKLDRPISVMAQLYKNWLELP